MQRHRALAAFVCLAVGLTLSACASSDHPGGGQAVVGRWVEFRHLPGVVDLAGPRGDGSYIVAAGGRLFVLSRTGALSPFARGAAGYATATGGEPYITLAGSGQVSGARCTFSKGTIFALQTAGRPGIIAIDADGRARRFVNLPAAFFPDGITFDSVGHFGHRLLVTAKDRGATTVLAIDCAGSVRTITKKALVMEGGITVAPMSFGRFAGDIIAPDELSGEVRAIQPNGTVVALVASGLPHGPDTGVESAGFLPPKFAAGDAAYLADRFTRGNRHQGTNSILRLPGAELIKAGARPGDLLMATEASARTIVVHCASSCYVRYIAIGPVETHAEGHVTFS